MDIVFFFFNDTATTEIYTLSLHDALPISRRSWLQNCARGRSPEGSSSRPPAKNSLRKRRDRKSTRLNSSHANISYAVFCLKKKKNSNRTPAEVRGTTSLDRNADRHQPRVD